MSGPFCRYAVVYCLFWVGLAATAGTPQPLNTGNGQPLQTDTLAILVPAGAVQPTLLMDFGFATDENFTPNSFFDSYTVTLQTTNQQYTVVFVTADASGATWAPSTPGALAISPGSINRSPISYPALTPQLNHQSAYAVSAAIPPVFVGQSVNIFFDLFDNGDSIASQGWFRDVQVGQVPEPGTGIVLLTMIFLWRAVKFKR